MSKFTRSLFSLVAGVLFCVGGSATAQQSPVPPGVTARQVWLEPIYVTVIDSQGTPQRILVQEGQYRTILVPDVAAPVPPPPPAVTRPIQAHADSCAVLLPSGPPGQIRVPAEPPHPVHPTLHPRGFPVRNAQRFQVKIEEVLVTRPDGSVAPIALPTDRVIASCQDTLFLLPPEAVAVTVRFREWDYNNKRFRIPALGFTCDLASTPGASIL